MPDLYIQPGDLQNVFVDDLAGTIQHFFGVVPAAPTYGVLEELLSNLYRYGRQNLCDSAVCVLFTVQLDTHHHNTGQQDMTADQLQSFVAKTLTSYAVELPPLYEAVVDAEEVRLISQFLEQYLLNFKLYRYLFKPVNLLRVVTKHSVDVTCLLSQQQIGHQQAQEAAKKDDKGAKKEADKPKTPDRGNRQQKQVQAFNITVLPLQTATLYVKPPELTVQEVRQQQIQQKVEEIKKTQDVVEVEKKIEVQKFAGVIELQVEQELEKVKQRILQELQGKKK